MLDRLAGNRALKDDLKAALSAGRLSHSVLLCGEAGTGAGFAALCLAADYLYPQGGPAAENVLKGIAPECIEVEGEGASGMFKVDRIREVRREVFKSALSAERRVVLLYGTQDLNPESGNALLKVLEEPPPGVLFILTASSPAAVLPTIRSRCTAYTLSPLSWQDCTAWLRANHPPCPEAELLSHVYAGHPGLCAAALTDPARAETLRTARALAKLVGQRDEYGILTLLARFEKDKPAVQLLLADFARLCAAALSRPELAGMTPKAAGRCIYRVRAAQKALAGNGYLKLVLTTLGIKLAKAEI